MIDCAIVRALLRGFVARHSVEWQVVSFCRTMERPEGLPSRAGNSRSHRARRERRARGARREDVFQNGTPFLNPSSVEAPGSAAVVKSEQALQRIARKGQEDIMDVISKQRSKPIPPTSEEFGGRRRAAAKGKPPPASPREPRQVVDCATAPSTDMMALLAEANKLTQDSSSFLSDMPPLTPRSAQQAAYAKAYEKAFKDEQTLKKEVAAKAQLPGGGAGAVAMGLPQRASATVVEHPKSGSHSIPPQRTRPTVPGKPCPPQRQPFSSVSVPLTKSLTGADLVMNIKSAAMKGNANAQYRMALMFHKGTDGVKVDMEEALRFYMLAAGSGHIRAQVNVGLLYQKGEGVEPSDAIAVRYFTRASDAGDHKAMYNLGMCYKNGKGVAQDNEEAVRLFTASANAGNTHARFVLGVLYQKGVRVEKNAQQALSYYTAAAEDGDAKSMCNLGVMYEGGDGVPRNDVLAVKYFEKAAENGDPNSLATMNIGKMCLQGRGGPKGNGPAEALKYVMDAANGGNAKAQYEMGKMFEEGTTVGVQRDFKEARKFFRLASRQGFPEAFLALGLMYMEGGRGAAVNFKVAAKALKEGAELGNAECMYRLGLIYKDGNEKFAADPIEAANFLRQAATKGHQDAKTLLQGMETLPSRSPFHKREAGKK